MRVAIVVAMAQGGVIGAGGGLAWNISDDLKHFKRVTLGKPVIMGRKTFESIGKPLPGRDNIVVTRSISAISGVACAQSIDEALAIGQRAAINAGANEICVIGGAKIYESALSSASRIYLTEIEGRVAGDTFFPALRAPEWVGAECGRIEQSDRNEFGARILILDRVPCLDHLKVY